MKNATTSLFLKVRVQKSQARFKRIRNAHGPDTGIGEFFLLVDVTAQTEDIYIPTSISSSKKPTGFVYHIEGTAEGLISRASVSAKGAGVTQLTVGTIVYTKIPKGKTGTFRILIEIRGAVRKSYKIVINRINYRHHPRDARYERRDEELHSKTLMFR